MTLEDQHTDRKSLRTITGKSPEAAHATVWAPILDPLGLDQKRANQGRMSMRVSQERPSEEHNSMFIKALMWLPWYLNEPNLSQT